MSRRPQLDQFQRSASHNYFALLATTAFRAYPSGLRLTSGFSDAAYTGGFPLIMERDVAADKFSASRITAVLFAACLNGEVIGAIDEVVQINGEKYAAAARNSRSAGESCVIAGNRQASDFSG
jgi:hypothetical protein